MRLFINILSSFTLLITLSSHAQDRNFVWTYNSTVLAKGAKDLEAWNTYRSGRNYFYRRLDTRLEFETGLTDHLQTALYFNAEHFATASFLDSLGGIADTSSSGIFTGSGFSLSSEWKYKISDAVLNKVGFAIYGELTLGTTETELEGKLIFDKKWNRDVLALNLVGEYEMEFEVEKGEFEKEEEMKLETDLAYMHFFKPQLGLGVELRQHMVMVDGKGEHGALFGGPTLFWSGDKYFMMLSAQPQLMNLLKSDENPGSLDLAEYEKFSLRLLLGFGL